MSKYSMPNQLFLLLSLISGAFGYVFAHIPFSEEALAWSPLAMILFALPAFVGICFWQGLRRGLLISTILSLFGFFIESIGVATGFPYGSFYYNDMLGNRLFSLVPWTLPFGWVPLVIGAAFLVRYQDSFLKKIFLGTLILIGVDFLLDPGAVAMGFWTWNNGGFYYGVPVTNFFGWLLSGSIGLYLLWKLVRNNTLVSSPLAWMSVTSFICTFAFWFGVVLSLKLYIAIFIGGIVGIVVLHLLLRTDKKEKPTQSSL